MSNETPTEDWTPMFPCNNVADVKKFYGEDIANRVAELPHQAEGPIKNSLQQALREHFDTQNHALNIFMNTEIVGAAPDPSDWKSKRSRQREAPVVPPPR